MPNVTISANLNLYKYWGHNMFFLASSREDLTLLHANNKGADQPAHLRSLVSALAFRSLKGINGKVTTIVSQFLKI